MAEFSFSKSLLGNKKRGALTGSHVAYGLFVLICCWAGAQMLSMLGLIPFLIGCTFIGVLALIVRWRQRR